MLQVPHHRAAHQHHDDARRNGSRYVKRMMHKPNSGISDAQGKTIFDFLAYDQAESQGQESLGLLQGAERRRDREAEGAAELRK